MKRKNTIKRRPYLTRVGAVLTCGALAGCGSDTESGGQDSDGSASDDTTGEQTPEPTPEPTLTQTPSPTPTATETASPTPASEPAVNIDKLLFGDNRWPRELESGMTLEYTVEVREGGPVVLSVTSLKADGPVFDTVIRTEKTGEIPIENDGTHYIQVGGSGTFLVQVRSRR